MHHARGLCALKVPVETARQIAEDYTEADITESEMAMLGYAAKVNCDQTSVTKEDIAALHAHGFDDCAIHDIVMIVGYFNFVNRVADGLGLELEPDGVEWAKEHGFEHP